MGNAPTAATTSIRDAPTGPEAKIAALKDMEAFDPTKIVARHSDMTIDTIMGHVCRQQDAQAAPLLAAITATATQSGSLPKPLLALVAYYAVEWVELGRWHQRHGYWPEAFTAYQRSIHCTDETSDHGDAHAGLAFCHMFGMGTYVHWIMGYKTAVTAAERGSVMGEILAARALYNGAGCAKDLATATGIYFKHKTNPFCQWYLAEVYINGDTVHTRIPRDRKKGVVLRDRAFGELERLASVEANPLAALDLSLAYGCGSHAVKPDVAREWHWTKMAMQAGMPSAMENAAESARTNYAVDDDKRQTVALKYCRAAAVMLHPTAMYELAQMIMNRHDGTKDTDEPDWHAAEDLLRKAARGGHAKAAEVLALRLRQTGRSDADIAEAKVMEKLADKLYMSARQINLQQAAVVAAQQNLLDTLNQ